MPEELLRCAVCVAEALRDEGSPAWLVGGAVRDLALGREPHDVDLATAAVPHVVERAFARTTSVGRAFGTILVHVDSHPVQVTTFRRERGYSDARRPDEVSFATTVEEDAQRRDFTCNAMYLDPLGDVFRDPTGGFDDLAHGRLRCVGDPAARFAEDGLRLMRLARFAAGLDLVVEEHTRTAAAENRERIAGVSPERLLGELTRIAAGPAPHVALALLEEIGLLEHLFPGAPATRSAALAATARLGDRPGLVRLLAVLLADRAAAARAETLALVDALRPSRSDLRGLAEAWELHPRIRRVVDAPEGAARSERLELLRHRAWSDAAAAFRALQPDSPEGARRRAGLDALEAELEAAGAASEPWIGSADLFALGIARGPTFGRLLREAHRAQLDGEVRSREEALAWIARRARDL